MATCTKEQWTRWNAKLSNGFQMDLQRFLVWNEKEATKSIHLPNGDILKAVIGWDSVLEPINHGSNFNRPVGVVPTLNLSIWAPARTDGIWCSSGLGYTTRISGDIRTKKSWNEIVKLTADWNEDRIMKEAKANMAGMKNPYII